jgi:multidrug transporter EmrE-like cation transporter
MPLNSIIKNHLPDSSIGIVVIFAICIAFCEAISQTSMKYYSGDRIARNDMFMYVGVVGYIMVSLWLLTSYRYESMGRMNMVWSCVSIITAYVIGFLVFQEYYDHYTICSIVLALGAIYVGGLAKESADDDHSYNDHSHSDISTCDE